jgi:D-glycero-alpha-D-manno-heptose 1-phosphate guanylyltransferase
MHKSAIILCGGLGTRLKSVLIDTPKCLAPINGIPFLYFLFKQLKDWDEIILSVGYLSEQVQDYAESIAHEFDFKIKFAYENEPLGTGGGIALACKKVEGKHTLVLNGDTMYHIQLDHFMKAHIATNSDLSLALKPMEDADRYGLVAIDEDQKIIAFKEKKTGSSGLINGGIYALRSDLFDQMNMPEKFSFEQDFVEPNLKKLAINGIIADAYFIDIGIPSDYEKAQTEIPNLENI